MERIFDELGLTSTEAITLFLKQVELQRGLPFNIKLQDYNATTLHAIQEKHLMVLIWQHMKRRMNFLIAWISNMAHIAIWGKSMKPQYTKQFKETWN